MTDSYFTIATKSGVLYMEYEIFKRCSSAG